MKIPQNHKIIKKPWPTKAAMEQIYEKNLWGGDKGEYYSGEGSHLREIVNPYVATVSNFLKSFDTPVAVCDLGCGDFNVGKELVAHTSRYEAIDIVPKLIAKNQKEFEMNNLLFHCLDISKDDLPSGDCALARQVLQHLSNSEVSNVLEKLKNYKFVIITEHVPFGKFKSNEDIISGQGIRLKKGSGINIKEPPFNFQVKSEELLLSTKLKEDKGVIQTTLYETIKK